MKYFISRFTPILITLALFSISLSARADFLGVYAGVGSWNHSSTGPVNYLGSDADLKDNYGLEDDFSGFAYLAFEHPFPLIPNIRVNIYSLKSSSNTTLTAANAFSFAGTSYTSGTAIATELKWDEDDTLLYYEFLDNVVSFDLGLGMKNVKASLSVTSAGTTNTLQIDESMPFVYSMLGAHIPGTGISFIIEETVTFLGDVDMTQMQTKIAYETDFMLGLELGYRNSKANLDGITNVTGEVEFSGPFANLLFHF